ncbi:MAG: DUF480 domain-containing protein [bacterium]|nr:DUF480 domain-containing protein [bacterium]
MPRTRKLDPLEIRVLGTLMEKEQTTPEYYPMTVNALVAACNQKSNRDPVMNLSKDQVLDTLERLRQDVLVWRSEGARTERFKHSMDRRWELDSASKAIMALLLLRGAQTSGELRSRSDRMHHFASIEEVEAMLRKLSTGFDALVRELARRPGQRENRWMHLVSAEEDPRAQAAAADDTPDDTPTLAADTTKRAQPSPTYDERLGRLEAAVAELREELNALKAASGEDLR